jgi:bla regulator protein blaR1
MQPQKTLLFIAVALVTTAIPMSSQTPADSRPSFEVATIKPNATGDRRMAIMRQPSGRFIATGVTLKMLMGFAYRLADFQISGGPNWINTDRWNIEAKPEDGSIPPPAGPPDPLVPDKLSLMVQSLLEERFQLKMHRETKELAAYELVPAPGGIKIKASEDQSSPYKTPAPGEAPPPPPRPQPGGSVPRGSMRMGRGDLEGTAVPIATLIQTLSQQLRRPVIDKTGLTGLLDYKLQWTPELGQGPGIPGGPEGPPPASDNSGPSIFTAVQEQLGLRLVSTKAPAEVLVIETAEKPTDN